MNITYGRGGFKIIAGLCVNIARRLDDMGFNHLF